MKHIIPCWPEFLRDLIERGNRIDNIDSAVDFEVGDMLIFYDWFRPNDYLIREVFCKPIGCYSIKNSEFGMDTEVEYFRRRAAPLELDAKARAKRERRRAANEKK